MNELNLQPCTPPLWARGGHGQTLLGHLIPSAPMLREPERHVIDLGDGDKLAAFLIRGKSDKVIYLFHGLSGDTEAHYIKRTAKLAQNHGHSVFMVNHRGCGAGAGMAYHPYHSGRAEDLSAAIEYGKSLFKSHAHIGIGFSLSGNALLLLLTGERGRAKPDFGISVNAPIDLEDGSIALTQGLSRIYDARFVFELRRDVARRNKKARELHGPEARQFHVPMTATLREFDNLYTAPAGGFENREDYYRSCSTKNLLTKISTKTVMLTAADDPFVRVKNYREAQLSASITLHIENHGGHLGYLTSHKTPLGTHRWLDYAIDESLKFITK
jgi:uncharacterized protein